jgi:hypothetical protein
MLLPLKLVSEDVVGDRKIAAFPFTWRLLVGTIETSSFFTPQLVPRSTRSPQAKTIPTSHPVSGKTPHPNL